MAAPDSDTPPSEPIPDGLKPKERAGTLSDVPRPAFAGGILGEAQRQMDAIERTVSFTAPLTELRIVQDLLKREDHIKRLMEPSSAATFLREHEERERRVKRLVAQDLMHPLESMREVVRNLELTTSYANTLAAQRDSVLESVRAHERAYGDIGRYVAKLAQPDLTDFQRPVLFQMDEALRTAALGGVTAWVKEQEEKRLGIVAWVEQDSLRKEAMARSFTELRAPWVRVGGAAQSVRAMVEIASIGQALKNAHPFEDGFSASLRLDFGDWRQAPDIDPQAFLTPVVRSEYYVKRGFDVTLTDFTDEAFAEALSSAELCDNYLDGINAETLAFEAVDAKTEVALRQSAVCQRIVSRLEFELRAFIETRMIAEFGPNWAKTKMLPTVHESMLKRQAAAQGAGRPASKLIDFADFNEYPLIICKKDVFPAVFKSYFRDEDFVRESFKRLHPLRLDAMHSRPMSNQDIFFAVVEAKRLADCMRWNP
jgi:hypothetical protein